MRPLLVLVSLCSLGRALAQEEFDAKPIVLTEETFDANVSEGFWLLEFYAPWCAHCKALKPVIEEAAAALDGKIKIGLIDATANKALTKKYAVKGYPTVKFRRDGMALEPFPEVKQYAGKKTVEAFKAFSERMHAEPIEQVTEEEKYETLTKDEAVWFIHRKAGDDNKLDNAFKRAASSHQHILTFGEAPADLAAAMGGIEAGTGEFVAQVEKDEVTYFPLDEHGLAEGEVETAEALTVRLDHWIYEHRLPTFNFIGAHNFRELGHNSGRWMVIGVVKPTEEMLKGDVPVSVDPFLNSLRIVAKDFKQKKAEKYVFGYLDGTKWEKFIEQFNLNIDALPRMFILDAVQSQFYEDSDYGLNESEIVRFITAVDDKIIPYQTEGIWGLPTRIWKMLNRWYPYSLGFLAPIILLIVAAVQMCSNDDEYEDDDDEGAQEETKKSQ